MLYRRRAGNPDVAFCGRAGHTDLAVLIFISRPEHHASAVVGRKSSSVLLAWLCCCSTAVSMSFGAESPACRRTSHLIIRCRGLAFRTLWNVSQYVNVFRPAFSTVSSAEASATCTVAEFQRSFSSRFDCVRKVHLRVGGQARSRVLTRVSTDTPSAYPDPGLRRGFQQQL